MIKLVFRVVVVFAIVWMLVPHGPDWSGHLETIMKVGADAAKFVVARL